MSSRTTRTTASATLLQRQDHARVHPAGGNPSVATNPGFTEVTSTPLVLDLVEQRLGEGDDRVLGRRVDGRARRREPPGERGDVHHVAVAALRASPGGTPGCRTARRGGSPRRRRRICSYVEVANVAAAGDPGVVHQDVDGPNASLHDRRAGSASSCAVRHVARDRERASRRRARSDRRARRAGRRAGRRGRRGATLRERHRRRLADPRRRAGDDRRPRPSAARVLLVRLAMHGRYRSPRPASAARRRALDPAAVLARGARARAAWRGAWPAWRRIRSTTCAATS